MAEIEEYNENIRDALHKLNKMINNSPLYGSNRQKWRSQCKQLESVISEDIRTCEQEIRGLSDSNRKNYGAQLKNFKNQLAKLRQQFENKLRQQSNATSRSNEMEQENPNSVMRVIQRGDETQDKANAAIDSMFGIVAEGISLADEINLTLNKQIEQLDRIHGKVKDTESALKRAQKTINYFVKALECDKCMMGLILLNVLAFIALIVLVIKTNSNK